MAYIPPSKDSILFEITGSAYIPPSKDSISFDTSISGTVTVDGVAAIRTIYFYLDSDPSTSIGNVTSESDGTFSISLVSLNIPEGETFKAVCCGESGEDDVIWSHLY